MIFTIDNNLFDKLVFYYHPEGQSNFTVVQDGVGYTLEQNDSILLNDKEVHLAPFVEVLEHLQKQLLEASGWWKKTLPLIGLTHCPISFYLMNKRATAFSCLLPTSQEVYPAEIKACLSYFSNLDHFKFVLAHEMGHFHYNFDLNTRRDKIEKLFDRVNLAAGVLCSFICILALVLIQVFLRDSNSIVTSLSMLSFFVLIVNFAYYSNQAGQNVLNHLSEYASDAYAEKMYPGLHEKYFTNKALYNDTHPADLFRRFALKTKFRVLIPMVLPWNLNKCESYREFKKELLELAIQAVSLLKPRDKKKLRAAIKKD